MKLKRSARVVLAISALSATLVTASPASAANDDPVAPPPRSAAPANPTATAETAEVSPAAADAMARQKGIPVPEATKRLREQKMLGERGRSLERNLAGHSGGSYLDSDGQLVVTTTDPASDATVARGGGRAQRVDDTMARLDSIKTQLDRHASKSGAGAVQGWYVDVPTNTVVVTVTEGASDANTTAMVKVASTFGASVRIEQAPATEAPQATAEYLVGGAQFTMSTGRLCSVGFNTFDSANHPVVLTAGHCVNRSGNSSRNGYIIGANRTANFPGDDFGTFWNSYPSYWLPSISVAKYNGTYVNVKGQWDNPPVGATVCKSGRTTFYTCGTIRALNQTVSYPEGVVYGLVRHDACVEGGDSGGSNVSADAYALGVTSGAQTPTSGAYVGQCLSKLGQQNVSWYQPVGEALTRNGLRLAL